MTDWTLTVIWSETIKPFDTNLELTMPNLANGRVNLIFNRSVLVQKSSSSFYSNFTLNLYIVYKLNNFPVNNNNNFSLINLFGTVRLVRNVIKCKFSYNRLIIALWSFGKGFDRNVEIFGVDNDHLIPIIEKETI